MSQPLTKADLTAALAALDQRLSKKIDGVEKRLSSDIHELRADMTGRFNKVDSRLSDLESEMKLLVKTVPQLAVELHLRNLVAQLKTQGITLDEARIFTL